MNQLCEMIGISLGEFQSWYNSGELRLSSDRFVNIEVSEDGTPVSSCLYIPCLFERLPDIGADDEEGILLIQLNPNQSVDNILRTNSIQTGTIFISIERLMRVIPLSDRARRILIPRMESFGIEISEPYFEDYARIAHCQMKIKDASRGGDALTNTLFTMEAGDIEDDLRRATKEGIASLEGNDNHPQEQSVFNWIIDAYSYTRKVPFKKGNIDYVMDSGVVLKSYCSRLNIGDSLVQAYRETAKVIADRHEPSASLCEILADLRAEQATPISGDEFFNKSLASLISLSIFLYWKEAFHKNNNEIDYQGLIDDVIKFNNGIDFESTLVAVWLLGNYAGFERIAPFIYLANSDRYSWFSGPVKNIRKITNTEGVQELVNKPNGKGNEIASAEIKSADPEISENSQDPDLEAACAAPEETTSKDKDVCPPNTTDASQIAPTKSGPPDNSSNKYDETEGAAEKQQTGEDKISHSKEQPKSGPMEEQGNLALEGVEKQCEREFKLGDKVEIKAGTYKDHVGQIKKINEKSALVEIDNLGEKRVALKNLK